MLIILLLCAPLAQGQFAELASLATSLLGPALGPALGGGTALGAAGASAASAGSAISQIGQLYQLAQATLGLAGNGVEVLNKASQGDWFPAAIEQAAMVNPGSGGLGGLGGLAGLGGALGGLPNLGSLAPSGVGGGGSEVGTEFGQSFPAPTLEDYEDNDVLSITPPTEETPPPPPPPPPPTEETPPPPSTTEEPELTPITLFPDEEPSNTEEAISKSPQKKIVTVQLPKSLDYFDAKSTDGESEVIITTHEEERTKKDSDSNLLPSTTPSAPTNKPVQEKIINVDRLIEVLSNKDEEISEILNQVESNTTPVSLPDESDLLSAVHNISPEKASKRARILKATRDLTAHLQRQHKEKEEIIRTGGKSLQLSLTTPFSPPPLPTEVTSTEPPAPEPTASYSKVSELTTNYPFPTFGTTTLSAVTPPPPQEFQQPIPHPQAAVIPYPRQLPQPNQALPYSYNRPPQYFPGPLQLPQYPPNYYNRLYMQPPGSIPRAPYTYNPNQIYQQPRFVQNAPQQQPFYFTPKPALSPYRPFPPSQPRTSARQRSIPQQPELSLQRPPQPRRYHRQSTPPPQPQAQRAAAMRQRVRGHRPLSVRRSTRNPRVLPPHQASVRQHDPLFRATIEQMKAEASTQKPLLFLPQQDALVKNETRRLRTHRTRKVKAPTMAPTSSGEKRRPSSRTTMVSHLQATTLATVLVASSSRRRRGDSKKEPVSYAPLAHALQSETAKEKSRDRPAAKARAGSLSGKPEVSLRAGRHFPVRTAQTFPLTTPPTVRAVRTTTARVPLPPPGDHSEARIGKMNAFSQVSLSSLPSSLGDNPFSKVSAH